MAYAKQCHFFFQKLILYDQHHLQKNKIPLLDYVHEVPLILAQSIKHLANGLSRQEHGSIS